MTNDINKGSYRLSVLLLCLTQGHRVRVDGVTFVLTTNGQLGIITSNGRDPNDPNKCFISNYPINDLMEKLAGIKEEEWIL
jgi:hypothetical protein